MAGIGERMDDGYMYCKDVSYWARHRVDAYIEDNTNTTAQVIAELRQLADDLENGDVSLEEYTRETIDFDPPEYILIRFDRTE